MLFKKYPAPAAYLSVGSARARARPPSDGLLPSEDEGIRGAAEQILHEFGGVVPNTMEGLVSLRGVGRKTASIVLGNAFKVPAVAVDRHVARVATRFGSPARPTRTRSRRPPRDLPAEGLGEGDVLLVLHAVASASPRRSATSARSTTSARTEEDEGSGPPKISAIAPASSVITSSAIVMTVSARTSAA